jgi:hypothetical protein
MTLPDRLYLCGRRPGQFLALGRSRSPVCESFRQESAHAGRCFFWALSERLPLFVSRSSACVWHAGQGCVRRGAVMASPQCGATAWRTVGSVASPSPWAWDAGRGGGVQAMATVPRPPPRRSPAAGPRGAAERVSPAGSGPAPAPTSARVAAPPDLAPRHARHAPVPLCRLRSQSYP